MRKGPPPGTPTGTQFLVKAEAAWTADLPDWVRLLAMEADRTTLSAAARRIGYSAPVVSQVITRTYGAAIGRVEEAVRGALMGLTVHCPALATEIGRETCMAHQRAKLSTASPQSVRLYHACRNGCPNAVGGGA